MSKRPILTVEEQSKTYSKYYYLAIEPIPEEKISILEKGPIPLNEALAIEKRNDLFLPGYLPGETGYCVLENKCGYLANLTFMPGVTTEMLEWWFAWHALDDLRYRIWDPEDHFYARQQIPEKVFDTSVPMREKTWGTRHIVKEDIGEGPDEVILNFQYPNILGFEEEKIGTESCSTMFCANGHGTVPGEGVSAIMTHFVREVADGIELRSRFWIGYGLIDGEIKKLIPDGEEVPLKVVKGLFAHNLKEFGHLATFLPKLYSEEKENF